MNPRSEGGGLQFRRPGSHNAEALRALKRKDGGDGVQVRWSAVAAWLLWSFSAAGIGRGPGSPAALLAAWTQTWYWYPLLGTSTLFPLLLFPSGLPSRRWRPVLWLSVLLMASVTVLSALSSTLDAAGRTVPSPIGLRGLTINEVEESLPFQVFG